jgi:transcriptional regulator with XRE-family HTH domain
MITDKFFSDALSELMEKNKITKIQLAKDSGISRAYLTQIIVHNVLPSKEIIEKISNALKLKPTYFKEYRVLEIIEDLEKYHFMTREEDIKQLKGITSKIKSRIIRDNRKFDNLKSKREVEFNPSFLLDITNLNNQQIKIIKYLYNEFMETNKGKELESKIMGKFLSEFVESEEFEYYLEAYKHEDYETIYDIAYRDYREEYMKKIKKDNKEN